MYFSNSNILLPFVFIEKIKYILEGKHKYNITFNFIILSVITHTYRLKNIKL